MPSLLESSSAAGPCPHLYCGSRISHLTIETRTPSSIHPWYIFLCSLRVHSIGPFLSTNYILKVIMLQRITCLQEVEMQSKQPLSKEEGINYSQDPRKGLMIKYTQGRNDWTPRTIRCEAWKGLMGGKCHVIIWFFQSINFIASHSRVLHCHQRKCRHGESWVPIPSPAFPS